MIEDDQLREEQWQEFDREDKEKSKESKSDRNRVIEDRKLDEGVAQAHVEAPMQTSTQFGTKGCKKKKSTSRKGITCYFCKMVGHIQKSTDTFKLMMGARSTLMPAHGLTSLQLPSLSDMSTLQGMTTPPTQRPVSSPGQQSNYGGQSQLSTALVALPKPQ